jgi:hypothetical protein
MVRGMRRWVLIPIVAVLAALLAAGCHPSPVQPTATVIISGRALSATGAPLASTQVHLYKEADFGEAVIGSVLTLGTLGGICLFPGAPAVCHKGHSATTGADGSYRLTLKGADTQGLVGDKATLDLVVADPAGGATGASTTVRFTVGSTAVTLPDARLWNAKQHLSEGSGQITLTWSAVPTTHGTGASYSAQLLDPARAYPIWSQNASGGRTKIDARILEDRAAAAAITVRTTLSKGVHAVYLSARTQVRPIAGTPPSRHRPCYAVTGTTTLAMARQTVCVATDGDLTSPAHLTPTNGKVVTGVMIDLGVARPISLVVARGTGGMVVVEVSSNGTAYREVATGSGDTVAVTPAGRPIARYVRVRSPGGLDESLLAEVSVW